MQRILDILINYFFQIRTILADILEPNLFWIKIAAVIISAFFVFMTIYCIIKSNFLIVKVEQWADKLGIGDVGKDRQLRVWRTILKYLKTEEIANWKLAIIKADEIFDEILKMSGYHGTTIHDRFNQLPREAISNYDQILNAHKVRDQIIQNPDFSLTQDEAKEIIAIYEQAFRELGLIS